MVRTAMKLILCFVIMMECCWQGTGQLQSCYDATGCGGNQVTFVSTARNCCLGRGLSFRDGSGICRQCIVHGFVQTNDLVINEGATQEIITMTLDVKGNTLLEPASTRVLNFGFSFMCIYSSNGGGPLAVDQSDFTDTGCGNNIQLRLFPSAQRMSEVGISALADNKIEGTEVLILRLMLTNATQTAVNNAGNIFLQDTLNIRVIDVTVVVIGFFEDDYTGDEGEPGDVSRPNTPCTVTVGIIERTLEIPLQIKLTPREGNATRRDFNNTVIVTEVPVAQTQLMQAIQIFDDEINEGREVFNVSLEVVGNISNVVEYRIQTTLCRIRQSDPIEIGFTQRRTFHTEEFGFFDTLINKNRASEQTFDAQVEISTLNSPFGQSATRGEDFNITTSENSIVLIRLEPSKANTLFDYFIYGDNTPENQEVFQLSITPAIGSPTFTCTEANGCFQQLEIVIVDDDAVVVGFESHLYTVGELDGQVELCVNVMVPRRQDVGNVTFNLTVETQDGSAASNDDYTSVSMTLGTFTSQHPRQCFTISITNDAITERTEDFTASLTLIPASVTTINASRIIVGPHETTVWIIDNDYVIVVGYNWTYVNVFEADGQAELIVSIIKPDQAQLIETSFNLLVNTQDGTATAPGDYGALTNFPLGPFNNSVRQLSFNVSIVNDNFPEDDEMFNVSLILDPADQARLGNRVTVSPDVATVTIQDNDAPTGPPLSLAVQSVNSTSLTLSWEPPSLAHQTGAILNYTLTCIPPAESGLPPLISVFTTAGAHTLNGLAPATLYSCAVFATNIYGNGLPATVSAMTEDGALCPKIFQLLLGDVNDCTEWRVQNTRQKLADITSSIISAINLRCQCSLTVNHISTAHFLCTSDRHVVLYRAELSGHLDCEQVLSHIEQWIVGGQTHIVVQGTSTAVYPNCPIEVDSLPTQIDCVRSTTTDTGSEKVGITAVGGGVGGVVLIGIMILAAAVCVCRYKHKQRTVDMKSNEAYGAFSLHEMKSNEAYGICHQRTCQQPNENNQMAQLSQPPIISPLSPHTGDLNPPTVSQIGNDASYATVTVKEEGFDESYENVEPEKEHSYEMVDVPQSPSEYI